eukprot:gnl/MRDRNA2_/MRDRNA2_59085_c0_seq2.p1 gnl/MRDRNA2_/MRDRNA2_59085_c0~~gnl/MRDRNA2_/MRDRNA2_59085_c0_seq2.p1  ORF type:complete len:346 (+),score=48.05 gnl/MRDRNA2_/MRDRNA2_59085_c0_seq2:105-1040(+)
MGAHTMGPGHDHSDVQQYLDFLNTLGVCASCCCIFSPMGSMFKIMRYSASGKELMGLLIPYSLYFAQCFLWSFYGILTDHLAIAQINVLGTIMCLMYLCIMANYAQLKDRVVLRPMVCLCVSLLFFLTMSSIVWFDQKRRLVLFSYSATFFAACLNIAPMVQSFDVIRTKSLEGFPVALTVAGFISSCIWSEYSLAIKDYGYLLPNLLGVCLNGIQIAIVFWVYKKNMEEDGEGSPMEPILSYVRDVKLNKEWASSKGLSASYSGLSDGVWTFFSGRAHKLGDHQFQKASQSAAFDAYEPYNESGRSHLML